jgi:hypothetical protein
MVPMNKMAQNMINKLGRMIPKDRLTHNQSWRWSSGNYVNSQVKKEQLQECRYGFLHLRPSKLGSGSTKEISK